MDNMKPAPLTKEDLEAALWHLYDLRPIPTQIEMPLISPRWLPELEARGYVKNYQWTHKGIEWWFGVPVKDE